MNSASIEVSGQNAEHLATELHAALRADAVGVNLSPVQVERSAEMAVAVIGLVFSGIGTAKTIWDWWSSRRSAGAKVRILLDDGRQIDLENVNLEQLQIEIGRRAQADD